MKEEQIADRALTTAEKLAAGQSPKKRAYEKSRQHDDFHKERLRAAIQRIRSDPRWKPGQVDADEDSE